MAKLGAIPLAVTRGYLSDTCAIPYGNVGERLRGNTIRKPLRGKSASERVSRGPLKISETL